MSRKTIHNIRDPIHRFVQVSTSLRDHVMGYPAFQRLRHIHQLALSQLIYPGATHKRFEHSIGVMHLAGRVFDTVTRDENLVDGAREVMKQVCAEKTYWRVALQVAALLHDIGHLPFSHAAESLLPSGWSHETFTVKLLEDNELKRALRSVTPSLRYEDVLKLAVGAKAQEHGYLLTAADHILAEIIVGDHLGVDRMDYLLRDSYHAGVEYGRFDLERLLESIRVLMYPIQGANAEPRLGIEEGALRTAEAMALARYSIYSQVYFHPLRKVYDLHLHDYLVDWLKAQGFDTYPQSLEFHQAQTDNEVFTAMRKAAGDSRAPGHVHARRIIGRLHFKKLWLLEAPQLQTNPDLFDQVVKEVRERFDPSLIKVQDKRPRTLADPRSDNKDDFPVWRTSERSAHSAVALSELLTRLPKPTLFCIYCCPSIHGEADSWLRKTLKEKVPA